MNIQNKFKFSSKQLLIDKNNTVILFSAAATFAIIVFSIVAATAIVKKMSYQNRVIGLRSTANQQLLSNINAADSVVTAYKEFEAASESAIGTADKNSKIVLDALPSKYDFPALATSLEAIVKDCGAKLDSITGTDNEAQAEQDSANPLPIEMPFQVSATGGLASIKLLVDKIEHSIRPIKILSITYTASGGQIQANISAVTYYQPEKKLEIQQSVVGASGKITASNVSQSKVSQ